MAEQYTPTTEDVRGLYSEGWAGWDTTARYSEESLAEFDRWLASHDAQVRAEALREAADDFETYVDVGGPVGAGMSADKWLRRRADRIADTNHADGDNT